MRYKCLDCGAIFDEEEVEHWREDRGEFWGMPCYENLSGCPICRCEAFEEYDEDAENDENNEDEETDDD